MEDYNKIYPELAKEDKIYPEPPKDGKAFRLQQSCQVLENLEKEAKHYASVRKKYKRCYKAMRTELVITCVTSCVSFVWIVFLVKKRLDRFKRLDRLNDRSFGSF